MSRDVLEENRLSHHQQKSDGGISETMLVLQRVQSFSEKMQDAEKINDDQHRVDHQFDGEGSERIGCVLFHFFQFLRLSVASRSPVITAKSKFCCGARR